jgi:hypothetical protein
VPASRSPSVTSLPALRAETRSSIDPSATSR